MTVSKTIVLIHGLFQNPKAWTGWKKHLESMGYTVHTPAYPYHEGEPSALRSHIDPALGMVTFGDVERSLTAFIDTLPEVPILIGHSMGGLMVQRLIASGRGVAGACIDAAPPAGIFSFKWSFLKANLPTINPLKGNSVVLPSVEWFQYAFCNTMTMEQTTREYNDYVVPESRNIPRSSTKSDGKIDFNKPHKPLLFIAGEMDHIIPASLNMSNYKAYTDPGSKRDYKVFAGRTHYICGQENWQEVADYIIDWMNAL